jgi:hypothetical protein
MRFLITDRITDEPGLTFSEATAVIASWWENAADFNEIEDAEEREHVRSDMARFVERVEVPLTGDIETLRAYSRKVCKAVAIASGNVCGAVVLRVYADDPIEIEIA